MKCQERNNLVHIMKAFGVGKTIFQSIVLSYKIELYFSELKLTIEHDENSYNDCNNYKEKIVIKD